MDKRGDSISKNIIASNERNKRGNNSKVVFSSVGAGLSAVSTLIMVLALALPYWIQFDETIPTTENGVVSDVIIKFTHGLWRYCNEVTGNGQTTEKCGTIRSYSDSDLAAQSLVTLSTVLSFSALVHVILYLSKIRKMSREATCLFIALVSSVISELLLISGLVIFGVSDHDIKITDNVTLEFSVSKLHVSYWLAATGCLTTIAGFVFIFLALFSKEKPYKTGTDSVASSKTTLTGVDNFSFTRKFADIPPSSLSFSEDSSDDEDIDRDPHPFVSKKPSKLTSRPDLRTSDIDDKEKCEDKAEDDMPDSDDSFQGNAGDMMKENQKRRKVKQEQLKVELSKEELKHKDALNSDILTAKDDKSKVNEIVFYESTQVEITADVLDNSDNFQKMDESEKCVAVGTTLATETERGRLGDLDEERREVSSEDPNGNMSDKTSKKSGDADQDNIFLKLDIAKETTEQKLEEITRIGNQGGLETTSSSINGPMRFQRELLNLSPQSYAAYTYATLSENTLEISSDDEDEYADVYPVAFENQATSGMPPDDTRHTIFPPILQTRPKIMRKPPPVFSKVALSKRTPRAFKVEKPKFHDYEKVKDAYDKPMGTIPQYPEVPFYKMSRNQKNLKQKRNTPSFKDSVLKFRRVYEGMPKKNPE